MRSWCLIKSTGAALTQGVGKVYGRLENIVRHDLGVSFRYIASQTIRLTFIVDKGLPNLHSEEAICIGKHGNGKEPTLRVKRRHADMSKEDCTRSPRFTPIDAGSRHFG